MFSDAYTHTPLLIIQYGLLLFAIRFVTDSYCKKRPHSVIKDLYKCTRLGSVQPSHSGAPRSE